MSRRQSFFSHITFLLSSEVSVIFNISYSHADTKLSISFILHSQFIKSKHLPRSHDLSHTNLHALGFHIN